MVETAPTGLELRNWEVLLPLGPAIVWWLREKLLRQADPTGETWDDLEIHHKKPKYRGGDDREENLQVVTRVEHAQEHYRQARRARRGKDRRANDWAVRRIVGRMTDEERKEFNRWVQKQR